MRFIFQDFIDIGDVADAKGDGVRGEGLVFEGSLLGVPANPTDVVAIFLGPALSTGPNFANFQHVLVDVEDCDVALDGFGIFAVSEVAKVAKGDIPGASGGVQEASSRSWGELVHEDVLPDTVDAETHGVVHFVVGVGDIFKDRVDWKYLKID